MVLMRDDNITLSEQGLKTLTTRVMLPGEYVIGDTWYTASGRHKGGRRKHYVGAIRLLSPKRGQAGVARIEVLELWEHPLQVFITQNMLDEGVPSYTDPDGLPYFERIEYAWIALWDSINKRKGIRWADNPRTCTMRYNWLGRIK